MRRLLYLGYGQLFASRQFLRGLTEDPAFMRRWQVRARSQAMDARSWPGAEPARKAKAKAKGKADPAHPFTR